MHRLATVLLVSWMLAQERVPVPPLSAEARAESRVVQGRLLDPDGTPLPRTRVLLRPVLARALGDDSFGASAFATPQLRLSFADATTDEGGAFRFDAVDPRAAFLLSVDTGANGRQTRRFEPLASSGAPISWRLARGSRLRGRVVDAETGAPLAKARVLLVAGFAEDSGLEPDKLAVGGGLLYPNADTPSVWIPPPWFADLLRRGAALGEDYSGGATAFTRDDGTFELAFPTPEFPRLLLRVSGAGHAEVDQTLEIGQGPASEDAGTIRLPGTVSARVRVLDEKGRPSPGAFVRVASGTEGVDASEPTSAPLSLRLGSETDAQGELDVALAPSAPNWLAIRGPGRTDWIASSVAVQPGVIEVRLPAPMSLDVHVEDQDGKALDAEVVCLHIADVGPCSGVEAYLPILVPDTLTASPLRTKDGAARFDGLARGEHFVLARAPGYAPTAVEVKPAQSIEKRTLRPRPFLSRSIRFLGLVEGAERPLAGVRIEWTSNVDHEVGEQATLPGSGELETDADGRARISCAVGARLVLTASHAGFASGVFSVAGTEEQASFVLRIGGSLAGRVHRSEKAISVPVWISLRREDGAPADERARMTSAEPPEGRFRLDGLAAGSYELGAVPDFDPASVESSASRWSSAELAVVIEEGKTTEIDVDLAPPPRERSEERGKARTDPAPEAGGPVTGVVVSGATNEPIQGASVWLCAADGSDPADPMSPRFTSSRRTPKDGGLAWYGVPSGTYWLRIFAGDLVWHYAKFEVVAGAPLDLGTIVLAQGAPVAGRVVEGAEGTERALRFKYANPPADRPPDFWLDYYASYVLVDETTGAFATRELAPGRYLVFLEKAMGDALDFAPLEIEIPGAGLTSLELRFQAK